jgi:aconitase B
MCGKKGRENLLAGVDEGDDVFIQCGCHTAAVTHTERKKKETMRGIYIEMLGGPSLNHPPTQPA